ncbi:FAD-dependent oxidoreductase [Spongiibacter taiwanensis]|uniref:protoporphyrinogen/coproporphyrinogen oxidase n=1 Tax=Spongiibacter taiwanensis TaxID=1748242 RepID=UPI00203539E0|nr:FAD-dependent oxidoreductase [Spongiibacter taiwanensis]USA42616.1 FAD-dependent oxidoreductase [Spongiibacter taiwanensis]
MAKILVIGAGPAGCTAAYRLQQRGHIVQVLEAATVPGGRTYTLEKDGFLIDTAAIFTMSTYHRTWALLRELALESRLQPWHAHTQLVEGDRRFSLRYDQPLSNLLLPCVSLADKFKIIKAGIAALLEPSLNAFNGDDLASIDNGENLEDWARCTLGNTAYEYVVKPNHDMLYALPPCLLSPAFQRATMQAAWGFSLAVPSSGMGTLCRALSEQLDLYVNHPVTQIEYRRHQGVSVHCAGQNADFQGDALIVATDAHSAATLLQGQVDDSLIDTLSQTPYIEYAQTTMTYTQDPWPDETNSMLVPVGKNFHPVNALVLHSKRNPASVPKGAQSLGFYYNSQALTGSSDAELIDLARRYRDRLLGAVAVAPDFEQVFRYKRGLTVPAPGHYRNMTTVSSRLPPRLALAGDYFAHAGIEAAVIAGERAANEVAKCF